jgi:hypothetical protein
MTSESKPTYRAPAGVLTEKPIAVRLLPVEWEKINAVAVKEQRSLASVCRLLALRGMECYDRDGNKLLA